MEGEVEVFVVVEYSLGWQWGGSRSRGSGILRTRSSRGTDNMNRKLFTKDRGGEGGVNSALEYLVGLEG